MKRKTHYQGVSGIIALYFSGGKLRHACERDRTGRGARNQEFNVNLFDYNQEKY